MEAPKAICSRLRKPGDQSFFSCTVELTTNESLVHRLDVVEVEDVHDGLAANLLPHQRPVLAVQGGQHLVVPEGKDS